MHRVFDAAYNSQHQASRAKQASSILLDPEIGIRDQEKLAPAAFPEPDFKGLPPSADPEAYRWNGTLGSPGLPVEQQKGHLTASPGN